jgi:RNA polymerase sigma-B factor
MPVGNSAQRSVETHRNDRAGELTELFVRWQTDRDEVARDALVERFMPLAHKLARRYMGGREPIEDLVQVASFGLLKALDRFDPSRGTSFLTFAVPTIVGELKRHFRDSGWAVHVPRGSQELALKVQRAQEALSLRTGRSPTVHELAAEMQLGMEAVLEGLEAAAARHAHSLDAPLEADAEAVTLADSFGDIDPGFEHVDDVAAVATAISGLSERDRYVLRQRFFEDRTQSEIAAEIGVSQMQVSRILRRAIAALSDSAKGDGP